MNGSFDHKEHAETMGVAKFYHLHYAYHGKGFHMNVEWLLRFERFSSNYQFSESMKLTFPLIKTLLCAPTCARRILDQTLWLHL